MLRESSAAEQLVDVPVPQTVILAHGTHDRGIRWGATLRRVRGTAPRASPPAQGGIQILGSAGVHQAVDVPVTMLDKFQQFYEFDILVPHLQFIDRVLDIAVMLQRQLCWCELYRRP